MKVIILESDSNEQDLGWDQEIKNRERWKDVSLQLVTAKFPSWERLWEAIECTAAPSALSTEAKCVYVLALMPIDQGCPVDYYLPQFQVCLCVRWPNEFLWVKRSPRDKSETYQLLSSSACIPSKLCHLLIISLSAKIFIWSIFSVQGSIAHKATRCLKKAQIVWRVS